MILLKIRGSCISYASFKKEETRLEDELMFSIRQFEDTLYESKVFMKAKYLFLYIYIYIYIYIYKIIRTKKTRVDCIKKQASKWYGCEIVGKMVT